MLEKENLIIAAKCAPQRDILCDIERAGLEAVELYLSESIMGDLKAVINLCQDFPFVYAVHAPSDSYNPLKLAELVKVINARVVVFHNIFWDAEWEEVIRVFKNIRTKLCVENVSSIHEPLRFMRRYGIGRCLDLEHLQIECAGVYEEEFVRVMKEAAHIHLTGYTFGSDLWHTHLHHSEQHCIYMLNLLEKSGYRGFVVSEARPSLQTYEEFVKLRYFYQAWESKKVKQCGVRSD
jgi:hypothetical protein